MPGDRTEAPATASVGWPAKVIASDTYNVDNELRKRLSPEAVAHIIRVPALVAENGSHIPIAALFRGSGMDVFYLQGLANEIEQMAKLLPPD